MMKSLLAVFMSVSLLSPVARAADRPQAFPAVKQSNQFFWDDRARETIRSKMPAPYAEALLQALSGPPNPLIRYPDGQVAVYSCRAHSCEEKGFFFYEPNSGQAIGALLSPGFGVKGDLYIIAPIELLKKPTDTALKALERWVEAQDISVSQLVAIDQCGNQLKLESWSLDRNKLTFKADSDSPSSCQIRR